MSKINLTYEEALAELQQIVTALEEDQLGMDALSEKVERAGTLLQYCKQKLHNTEENLDNILEKLN